MNFITGLSVDGLGSLQLKSFLEELQNYVGILLGKMPATSDLSS
ncbi:hypothetical protein LINPERHAP2_LOCUS4429 [Linum perenne]